MYVCTGDAFTLNPCSLRSNSENRTVGYWFIFLPEWTSCGPYPSTRVLLEDFWPDRAADYCVFKLDKEAGVLLTVHFCLFHASPRPTALRLVCSLCRLKFEENVPNISRSPKGKPSEWGTAVRIIRRAFKEPGLRFRSTTSPVMCVLSVKRGTVVIVVIGWIWRCCRLEMHFSDVLVLRLCECSWSDTVPPARALYRGIVKFCLKGQALAYERTRCTLFEIARSESCSDIDLDLGVC